MRNIFDQYCQPENRVTHALMTAINEDRKLLASFLGELDVKPPVDPGKLDVLEQQYPEEDEPSEDELERRGIPDGWIFNKEERWCIFIETKVTAKLTSDQINRHRDTAAQLGFQNIIAVAISPRRPHLFPDAKLLEWRQVYKWLRQQTESRWASKAADYLEVAEANLIGTEQFKDTLTMFSGFPFADRPFTYVEGKRILKLALDELRSRRALMDGLGMNPKSGRPAITGRQGNAVWDFLSLSTDTEDENFTNYPHLTLTIVSHAVEAMVTVPHAVNNLMKRKLIELGTDGFQALVEAIVKNLKPLVGDHEGAIPWFRGLQRRYPSQRAIPFVDARIEFDLRTAIASGGPPKTQPRWLSAAYGAFVNKEGSNYQIQIGVMFEHDRCRKLRQPEAIDLIESAWLACKPLVDLTR